MLINIGRIMLKLQERRNGQSNHNILQYVKQKRLSSYGHVMKRDNKYIAKDITTMKVGGKRPRERPILR